jgi:protein SCO1
MTEPIRKTDWLLLPGLILVVATLCVVFLLARMRWSALFGKPLPVYSQVSDFTLTNQFGNPVTLEQLRGHPWVADIIFTRCAGPCLKMSRQMMTLQQDLSPSSQARLISLTTDPDYDSPAVLKTYAERFRADPNRWFFLTGSKQQIASLARDSLKLTAIEKKPEDRESPVDLFIHSTIFVVVDKSGRLRGVFQSTGEGVDPEQVKSEIRAALRRLERES